MLRAFTWLLASGLCFGCKHQHFMHAQASSMTSSDGLEVAQAGVASVDITPPPGLSLFGHGPEGRIAEGTLLRLHCQAFVLVGARSKATPSEALAFVTCDLPVPSLLLQREVARLVQAEQVPLGADRIWLAATHTHAGPGHYMPVENWTGPFSGRRLGFDPEVLDFLASRIAGAVRSAFRERKQARWGWAAKDLSPGLGRNRAYETLHLNRSLPEILVARMAHAGDDPAQNAVDLQMSLLRIDQRDGPTAPFQAAAALVLFGLHPTVISNQNTLYGGDAFGYGARALSAKLSVKRERPVIVGIANGIEGDVTSVRAEATPREARRVGEALAERALEIWKVIDADADTMLDAQASVHSGYRDLRLSEAKVGAHDTLCKRPELGTPAGGGANDHPTFLRVIAPYNPGVVARDTSSCHKGKYPIQGLLGRSEPGHTFPGYGPIGVARIGNGVLVTLPAEVTTVVGLRIKESAAELVAKTAHPDDVIALAGLTHEYLGYVASADEYAAQHYEGASTLYGPASAEFLREQVACLTRQLLLASRERCRDQAQPLNQPQQIQYWIPTFRSSSLARVPSQARGPLVLTNPRQTTTPDGVPALQIELHGVAPSQLRDPSAFRLAIVDESESTLDDEQGPNIRVQWDDEGGYWLLTWTPQRPCERIARLRWRVRAGRTLEASVLPDAATQASENAVKP